MGPAPYFNGTRVWIQAPTAWETHVCFTMPIAPASAERMNALKPGLSAPSAWNPQSEWSTGVITWHWQHTHFGRGLPPSLSTAEHMHPRPLPRPFLLSPWTCWAGVNPPRWSEKLWQQLAQPFAVTKMELSFFSFQVRVTGFSLSARLTSKWTPSFSLQLLGFLMT